MFAATYYESILDANTEDFVSTDLEYFFENYCIML